LVAAKLDSRLSAVAGALADKRGNDERDRMAERKRKNRKIKLM